MISSEHLLTYREELGGWKLTALQLTANGRFLGYESKFLGWVEGLGKLLRAPDSRATGVALHEFDEAYRRIKSENDDLFPDICDRLERTLILAQEVSYEIPRKELEDFEQACKRAKVDPVEQITDWIRVFLKQKHAVEK